MKYAIYSGLTGEFLKSLTCNFNKIDRLYLSKETAGEIIEVIKASRFYPDDMNFSLIPCDDSAPIESLHTLSKCVTLYEEFLIAASENDDEVTHLAFLALADAEKELLASTQKRISHERVEAHIGAWDR